MVDEIPVVERDLIKVMLVGDSEVVKLVLNHLQLEDITHPFSRHVIELLFDLCEDGKEINPSEVLDMLSDQRQKNIIANLLIQKEQPSSRWKEFGAVVNPASGLQLAIGALLKIKKKAYAKLIENNLQFQQEASRQGKDTTPFVVRHTQIQSIHKKEMNELEAKLQDILTKHNQSK
jgi:replicative DNA helicase